MPSTATGRRLDLDGIEARLQHLQAAFARLNARLPARRDPLDDRVLANLLEGYAYVDRLVADGVDVFAFGHLQHLLELNALVLCGHDAARRDEAEGHLAVTEERFYDTPGAGIRRVVDWLDAYVGLSSARRAAGVFARVITRPQLFVEGNHRTGALMMSYLLARDGLPPFVLSPQSAPAFFRAATYLRDAGDGAITRLVRVPLAERRLAQLIERSTA